LTPASGTEVTGKIFLEPAQGGVRIYGYVGNLTAGSPHGFHIHVWGDITNSTGSAAGGHYNPANVVCNLPTKYHRRQTLTHLTQI